MKALMLGACLAAAFGAPALAQPYDQDQPDPYYDQAPPQAQQPPDQEDYQGDDYDQSDRGYGQYQPPPPPPAGQPGFQYYQGRQGYPNYQGYQGYPNYQGYQGYPSYQGYQGYQAYPGYQGNQAYQPYAGYGSGGARYTGRVGPSWRNAEGQSCVYREMTWTDQNGRPAYRWVPRCR